LRKLKTVSFGDESQKKLTALREEVGAGSDSEVIRNALRFYEFVVQETKAGSKFLIRGKDGEEQLLHFLY